MAKKPLATLKSENASQIRTNGAREITGAILQARREDDLDSGMNTYNVSVGEVPMMAATDGVGEPSGLRKVGANLMAPLGFTVERGSINFGANVRVTELNSFLSIVNEVIRAGGSDTQFQLVDYRVQNDGASFRPRVFRRDEAENPFVLSATEDTPITLQENVSHSFTYTATLDSQVNSFIFQVGSALTNVRARVSDTATGVVIKDFPSTEAWDTGTGGQDYPASPQAQVIDLEQSQMINFVGDQLTVEIRGTGSILGNSAGFPALTAMIQRGEFVDLPYILDIQERFTKDAARYKTTGNVTLSGTQTIDGASPAEGDRILVASQTDASENGIYDYNSSGAWTRSNDFDTSEKVNGGAMVFVRQGATGANTLWYLSTTTTITLGTTDLAFAEFQAGGATGTAPITSVQSYSATGTQNFGGELGATFHIMESTVTSFDLLTGATIANNSLFAIQNQSSSTIEFDVSAHASGFVGLSSADAYDIAAGATALFYANGSALYLLSDTAPDDNGDDHPITLTRDTPTLATLAALADASTNDNSAVWIVASNQIAATESSVDASVMIRALTGGILDANGVELPTTATAKSGIVLAGGTIVRVFSSTDLRVVSGPGSVAQTMRYPDIAFTGAIRMEETLPESESLYNTYLGRTATNGENTTNQYIALPSLHTLERPTWVTEGDVFVMRNTGSGTGSNRPHFRPDNTGDAIAGHGLQYFADPGETIAVQAPRFGNRTWQLFPVSQRSDGGTYYDPEMVLESDWYTDDEGALAADRSVRLHNTYAQVDGNVRDHIHSASGTNNPLSIVFEGTDYQDDIAWIEWWRTFDASVPALGATANEIIANIAGALSYIETNINNGYDFTIPDPGVLHSITSIAHQSGDTVKVNLGTALSTHMVVNDPIEIAGANVAGNNGTHTITSIYPDRLAFDIDISGASAANNESGAGTVTRNLYADAVLVSHVLRQVNFDLYRDVARTEAVTQFFSEWTDIETDPAPTGSFLNIGYNTDVDTTSPLLATENRDRNFYLTPRGPIRALHLLFNGDPNDGGPTDPEFSLTRAIPDTHPVVHIQTQAAAEFYFNTQSKDIPVGESRLYRVYSDADNDGNDVTLRVGHSSAEGWFEFFDGDIPQFSLQPGAFIDIEGYNDGTLHGWRLGGPFQKVIPSENIYDTPVTAFTGNIPMNVITQVPLAQSEDPSYVFLTSSSNKLLLKTGLEYRIEASIDVLFNGAEGTGLLFVPVTLMPVSTRASVDTDQPQYADTKTLLFSRNGQSGGSAPKFAETLTSSFTWQAESNDLIGMELRLGTFPSGYSISDLQLQNFSYTVTVQGNLD